VKISRFFAIKASFFAKLAVKKRQFLAYYFKRQ
jgi:hypothetical protein